MRFTPKIHILTTSLCLLTIPATAHAAVHNLSGLYVGAGVGRAFGGDTSYKASVNGAQVMAASETFSGILVQGIFGGQKDMGSFVLGGELTVGSGNAKATKRENNRSFKVTQKATGDLVARVGYKVAQDTAFTQEIMAYASGGLAYTAFVKNIPAENLGVPTRHVRRIWGAVIGAGVEARVKENYLVAAEVKRFIYKEDKLNMQGTAMVSDTFKPRTMAVIARVTYKIN